jgi:hypothetical protein
MSEFQEFPKMPRLSREVIITEKIDGTNAQIFIGEDGEFLIGSRTRWITPAEDNYGFAAWVMEHKDELLTLGPGRHFGEWWGRGIQRNYSMTDRVLSLFNVSRWADDAVRPKCCRIVPILYQGPFETYGVMKGVQQALKTLETEGSQAAPGFMNPEGIVVFHTAGNFGFKKTFEKDEKGKGQ